MPRRAASVRLGMRPRIHMPPQAGPASPAPQLSRPASIEPTGLNCADAQPCPCYPHPGFKSQGLPANRQEGPKTGFWGVFRVSGYLGLHQPPIVPCGAFSSPSRACPVGPRCSWRTLRARSGAPACACARLRSPALAWACSRVCGRLRMCARARAGGRAGGRVCAHACVRVCARARVRRRVCACAHMTPPDQFSLDPAGSFSIPG